MKKNTATNRQAMALKALTALLTAVNPKPAFLAASKMQQVIVALLSHRWKPSAAACAHTDETYTAPA